MQAHLIANHGIDARLAAAGVVTSSRAAATTILVEAGEARRVAGCDAAGGFASGVILALPVLLGLVILRRAARR